MKVGWKFFVYLFKNQTECNNFIQNISQYDNQEYVIETTREMINKETSEEELSEEELDIVKRARNHKNNHKPKYASIVTYKNATGLEALIGYLYLNGENDRLLWILGQIEDVVAQGGH